MINDLKSLQSIKTLKFVQSQWPQEACYWLSSSSSLTFPVLVLLHLNPSTSTSTLDEISRFASTPQGLRIQPITSGLETQDWIFRLTYKLQHSKTLLPAFPFLDVDRTLGTIWTLWKWKRMKWKVISSSFKLFKILSDGKMSEIVIIYNIVDFFVSSQ